GSGKTAVLIEHILERICREGGTDVDRLLVVTFTKAAAAEMRERLYKGLNKRLDEAEAEGRMKDVRRLQRQLKLLPHAMVCTIDSFCMNVVRNHIAALDVDPAFRIADEDEAALIRSDVMDALLEEEYGKADEAFLRFAETFMSTKNDTKLRNVILETCRLCEQSVDPDALLETYLKDYRVETKEELRERPWFRQFRADFDAKEDYVKLFDEDLALAQAKLSRPFAEELVRLTKRFREAYAAAKAERRLADFSDLSRWCIRLLYGPDGARTEEAEALSMQFDEIMIDEYQDSNDLQETILTAVSRETDGRPNILMVGDAKQSIYGFRNARPQLFMEKYRTYTPAVAGEADDRPDEPTGGPAEETPLYRRIELNRNFRSRKQVLSAANAVFNLLMHADKGGIDYTDDVRLNYGATFPEAPEEGRIAGKPQVLQFDCTDKEALGDASEAEWEARMIGEEILRLVDPETGMLLAQGKDSYRRAQFRDIVILARKTTSNTEFIRRLEDMNIPVYAESKEDFFETWEVSLILHLLAVIDNALNDVPLYALLRSPVCGFDDAMLAHVKAWAKQAGAEGPFFSLLKAYAEDGDSAREAAPKMPEGPAEAVPEKPAKEPSVRKDPLLQGKLRDFLERLDGWIRQSNRMRLSAFLRAFYEESRIYEFVSAMSGGRQRQKNLDELLIRAGKFEKTSYQGIFNFLRYIEERKQTGMQEGEPSVQDEADNVVRIMTIHKSKGLEFPIVFVACCGKSYRGRGRDALRKNYDWGFALQAADLEANTTEVPLFGTFIDAQNEKDEIGEEQRLLYVAMTRAKEQLYLTGTFDKTTTDPKHFDDRSYMKWLQPLLRLPEVQAEFEEVTVRPADLQAMEEKRRKHQLLLQEELLRRLADEKQEDPALEARLSYNYLYDDLYKVRATVSVSKLKQIAEDEEGVPAYAGMPGALFKPRGKTIGMEEDAALLDDIPVTDDPAGEARPVKLQLSGAER
ncbi:MAG: UvrD-helicase domain-containing protein, partial [Lachnospiraceae bacterium]|nr:UvrD-helicase domain-containing protein [Lachnospiraceae bacterium]